MYLPFTSDEMADLKGSIEAAKERERKKMRQVNIEGKKK